MTLNEYLLEKKLLKTNDFSFGFEFEAFSSAEYRGREFIKKWMEKYFQGGSIVSDGSIDPKQFHSAGWEYRSPVLKFTTSNCKTLLKMLTDSKDAGIQTNKSCGFHVHMSFKNHTTMDYAWLLCNLAMDNNQQRRINYLNKIRFFEEDYAPKDFLNSIANAIKTGNYGNLTKLLTYQKFRSLRIHPQGTIEWRGPRNFIKSEELIKSFIAVLNNFVAWMIQVMKRDNETLGKINRQELERQMVFVNSKATSLSRDSNYDHEDDGGIPLFAVQTKFNKNSYALKRKILSSPEHIKKVMNDSNSSSIVIRGVITVAKPNVLMKMIQPKILLNMLNKACMVDKNDAVGYIKDKEFLNRLRIISNSLIPILFGTNKKEWGKAAFTILPILYVTLRSCYMGEIKGEVLKSRQLAGLLYQVMEKSLDNIPNIVDVVKSFWATQNPSLLKIRLASFLTDEGVREIFDRFAKEIGWTKK